MILLCFRMTHHKIKNLPRSFNSCLSCETCQFLICVRINSNQWSSFPLTLSISFFLPLFLSLFQRYCCRFPDDLILVCFVHAWVNAESFCSCKILFVFLQGVKNRNKRFIWRRVNHGIFLFFKMTFSKKRYGNNEWDL